MAQAFWNKLKEPWSGVSRRDLFRQGGLFAAAQAFGGSVRQAVAAPLEVGANMYRSIGVRPVINARGTFTIITGSQTLPEVKRAMDQASRGASLSWLAVDRSTFSGRMLERPSRPNIPIAAQEQLVVELYSK